MHTPPIAEPFKLSICQAFEVSTFRNLKLSNSANRRAFELDAIETFQRLQYPKHLSLKLSNVHAVQTPASQGLNLSNCLSFFLFPSSRAALCLLCPSPFVQLES